MTDIASFDLEPAPSALEILLQAGVVDAAAAKRAQDVARRAGESVICVIHQLALAPDEAVTKALAAHLGLAVATDSELEAAEALPELSAAYLRQQHILPLSLTEETVVLAVVDPDESAGQQAVAFATGKALDLRLATYAQWSKAFERIHGGRDTQPDTTPHDGREGVWADDAVKVRDQREAAPAVRLVDRILEMALQRGASDIHIEPLPDRVRIRFRVNGELNTVAEESAQMGGPIAARIKILANMDVADRRSPQDGRTSLAALGRPVDVRISTVPGVNGEAVALRLLRRDDGLLQLSSLGFSGDLVALMESVLHLRRGLFLVTGPTGSGKTTTLYAMLQRLRRQPLKILSIEDPIEYYFADITQVQVNEAAGVTFASALRSFLRQDPDVILVGEIRDPETASIAIQAALTGHLVLATLHTPDAPSAVTRLVDMGVDRYLVSATLNAVISQRLTPSLCPDCRKRQSVTSGEAAVFLDAGLHPPQFIFQACGCHACGGTGQKGRLALGEGFRVTDDIREAMTDPSGLALEQVLRGSGYVGLMHDAVRLADEGAIGSADLRALMLA